jgi:hypothetical protein
LTGIVAEEQEAGAGKKIFHFSFFISQFSSGVHPLPMVRGPKMAKWNLTNEKWKIFFPAPAPCRLAPALNVASSHPRTSKAPSTLRSEGALQRIQPN